MEIQGNTLVKGVDEPHVVIPKGVEIIGTGAFQGYSRLTSVELPSSLTSIERGVFDSTGLTSLTLPGGLTNIGGGAFSGCIGLTSVELPRSLTSIGNYAF